jgi:hypothetical protein
VHDFRQISFFLFFFKKNTELEIFLASMNGFGEEGGKALVTALTENSVIKEIDLSSNRITDSVLTYLTRSLDELPNLSVINVRLLDCLLCELCELNLTISVTTLISTK